MATRTAATPETTTVTTPRRWRAWRWAAAHADRARGHRGDQHLPDCAATRRPDGSGVNRTRRCPRAGDAVARQRRRGCRGRRYRRRREVGAPRHADTGGGERVLDRQHAAGPAGAKPPATSCWWNPRHEPARHWPPVCATATASTFDSDPNCTLREANRAGSVRFGPSDTYDAKGRAITRCYDGALIRYRDGGRTVTVVGSTDFMTNDGLLHAGNAALAMNLAGDRPRLIWYAPHRVEGENVRSDIDLRLDSGQRHLGRLAAGAGRATGGVVEGTTDRSVGGRAIARRGARVGDGRGARPALPVPPGT